MKKSDMSSAEMLLAGLKQKMETLDKLEAEISSDTHLIMQRVDNLRGHMGSLVDFVSTIVHIEDASVVLRSIKKKK